MVDNADDMTIDMMLTGQGTGYDDSGVAVDSAWKSLHEAKAATDRLHRALVLCDPPENQSNGHAPGVA